MADSQYAAWIASFAELGSQRITASAAREWRLANELFLSATQNYAHVLSGDLKRSGRLDVDFDTSGTRIEAMVTYGGTQGTEGPVDYAIYELARGGSHDFMRRGYLKAEKQLEAGVGRSLMSMMRDTFER